MLFISHSTKDKPAALALRDALLAGGYSEKQLFLDSDADSGIGAGTLWEQQLYSHLRRCVALVAICSKNFDESGWCFAEVVRTKDRGKPIFPVFIQDCGIRAPLGDHQAVFLHRDGDAACERLFKALEAAKLGPIDFLVWEGKDDDCPYPGLPAFDEKLAGVYFGREGEIESLRDQLKGMRGRGEPRFLMLTGGSGSGKSSLLKAGLLPRLRHPAARQDWIVLPVLRFGQSANEQLSIFDQLAVNLATTFPKDSPWHVDWQTIRAQLGPDRDTAPLIATLLDLAIALGSPDATVLIPIDQFEELLAPSAGEVAVDFIRFLTALCSCRNGRLLGIGTMRSDYLDVYGNHPHTLKGNFLLPFILGPFPKERIGDVILKPAECAGVEITDELLAKLKADAPGEECLPLLAFTLEKLYRTYAGDGKLELSEYLELGGMEGSIQKCVERVQQEIPFTPERRSALRRCFVKHLVQINDKDQPVRETARWDDLDEAAKPILEAFIKERLLIASHHQDQQDSGKKWITVEVAHEALFRCWKDLNDWIAKSIDVIRWRQAIRRDRRENAGWHGLTPAQLATARNWPKTRKDELADKEVAWINSGIRRQRGIRASIAVVVLLFAGLAAFTWWKSSETRELQLEREVMVLSGRAKDVEKEEAERAERRSLAKRLASESQTLLDRSPRHAAILAAKALQVRLPDGDESRLAAMAAANRVLTVLSGTAACGDGLNDNVRNAIFDRSENLVAVSSSSGIQVIDLTQPPPRSVVHDFFVGDGFELTAFDGTGLNLLGTLLDDESKEVTATVWDLRKKSEERYSKAPLSDNERVGLLAASYDNCLLAASGKSAIFIYDLNDISKRRILRKLEYENGDPLSFLKFARDGRLLLAGSRNGWVQIWRLDSDESMPLACFHTPHSEKMEEEEPVGGIRLMAISDDHTALLTAGTEEAMLWHLKDFEEGPPVRLLEGTQVSLAQFLPGPGAPLITKDDSGRVSEWPTGPGAGAESWLLLESQDSPDLQLSPDRRAFAVCHFDGSLGIHGLTGSSLEPLVLRGCLKSAECVRFSPSGKWLVEFGDGAAHLWTYDQGKKSLASSMLGRPGVKYEGSMLLGAAPLVALFTKDEIEVWDRSDPHSSKLRFAVPSQAGEDDEPEDRLRLGQNGAWIAVDTGDFYDIVMPTDPARGAERVSIYSGTQGLSGVEFSPDARWLALAGGGPGGLRDLRSRSEGKWSLKSSRSGHMDWPRFSADGNWIFAQVSSVGDKDRSCLWRLDPDGPSALKLEVEVERIQDNAVFSVDGVWLAFANYTSRGEPGSDDFESEEAVNLVRLRESGLQVQTLGAGGRFTFSPDSKWLMVPGDQPRLWDLSRGAAEVQSVEIEFPESSVDDAIFSGDSKYMVTTSSAGSGNLATLWKCDDAKRGFVEKDELHGRLGGLNSWSASFSPDSSRVAFSGAGDSTLHIWFLTENGISRKPVPLFSWQREGIGKQEPRRMLFSRDSTTLYVLLASGEQGASDQDETSFRVVLFDVRSPEREISGLTIYESCGHGAGDFQLDEESGTLLVVGDTLHAWTILDQQTLISKLGEMAGRNLTWDEWVMGSLPGPYQKVFVDLPVPKSVQSEVGDQLLAGDSSPAGWSTQQIVELAGEGDDPVSVMRIAAGLARQGKGEPALRVIEPLVKLYPDTGIFRDVRAEARALTGDIKGAREDLEFCVKNPWYLVPEEREQRREWLRELSAGRNPFANGYPKKSP